MNQNSIFFLKTMLNVRLRKLTWGIIWRSKIKLALKFGNSAENFVKFYGD
jgi:hypothetical protein